MAKLTSLDFEHGQSKLVRAFLIARDGPFPKVSLREQRVRSCDIDRAIPRHFSLWIPGDHRIDNLWLD